MRSLIFLFAFLITHLAIGQRPDLNEILQEVEDAANDKERALALTKYGDALPNYRYAEILDISDSILLLTDDQEDAFYKGASEFLKGVSFFKSRDFPIAKAYFKNSIDLLANENEHLYFRAKNILGLAYVFQQQRDSAIYHFNELLEELDPENTQAVISAHGNLGLAYKGIGEYGKAIYHFQKTLELNSTDIFGQVNTKINIGQMYADMDYPDRALEVLNSMNFATIPPQPIKSAVFNNLANNFERLEQLDSAIYYWEEAVKVNKEINRRDGLYFNLMELAGALIRLERTDEAALKIEQARTILPELRRPDDKFRFDYILGKYHLERKSLDSAQYYLEDLIDKTKFGRQRRMRLDSYKLLADIYEKKDDLAKSNEYLKLQSEHENEMRDAERAQFLANAKANYLLAVKEGEIDEKTQQIKSFSTQKWILITAIVIILSFLIFYIRNYVKTASGLAQKSEKEDELKVQIRKQKIQLIELKSKALLDTSEIISVKADGHYIEFYVKQKERPEIDRNRLKEVLDKLPDYFVQIHRSYIINLKEVRVKMSTKVEMKNGQELPISRTYKGNLNTALERFNN